MAKTNKYTSINFNHIYEKTFTKPNNGSGSGSSSNSKSSKSPYSSASSSYASPSYSAISSTQSRGRIVLTLPTPKPISAPPPQPQPQPQTQPQRSDQIPDQGRAESGSDQISLRPLGHTGTASQVLSPVPSLEKEKQGGSPALSSKPGKFVPPHLRPGFAGREERPGPEMGRGRDAHQNNFGSPGRYGEGGRPKSGGGYERMSRGGDSDLGIANRPRSGGNRPSSSGWESIDRADEHSPVTSRIFVSSL